MFGIPSQLGERFGDSLEEKGVNDLLIPQGQGSEPFGKGKDHVEVGSGE
jgi:hypothetical protein